MSAYTLTDLGPGVALDVSESGCVCGRNDSGDRDAGGWFWDRTVRLTVKSHTQDGFFFTARTLTQARDDGTCIGEFWFIAMDPSSAKKFLWTPGIDHVAVIGDGPATPSTRTTNATLAVLTSISGHAFTVETAPGHHMQHDLNFAVQAPGWVLTSANAINSKGQIVGGGTLNGQPRAYLLTPVAHRVAAVESYAGFMLPAEHAGKRVRVLASDTDWSGAWRELAQVLVGSPPQVWIDTSAPRRKNRDYKVEPVA